jgi:hypothetical protein
MPGVAHADEHGRGEQRAVQRPGRRGEQRATKPLPANQGGRLGLGLALLANESRLAQRFDEARHVDVLAVGLLVPAGGVERGSARDELANQRRPVGREGAVGTDVGAPDDDLTSVFQE